MKRKKTSWQLQPEDRNGGLTTIQYSGLIGLAGSVQLLEVNEPAFHIRCHEFDPDFFANLQ
ncbi:MAG: hypothetical protein Q7S71_05680, partial [Candidatus Nitrotoga sp.]|nr:hypothetical protein [Candidatus Nitrotoga sp.]